MASVSTCTIILLVGHEWGRSWGIAPIGHILTDSIGDTATFKYHVWSTSNSTQHPNDCLAPRSFISTSATIPLTRQ
ncbi:hypothetical protein PR002_g27675 [Phytophthora rubi]|uniref:Secreted protein n=1 Tax=Phytophthora rubi TaxID=129364 RepID=A0A6A3HGT7_9STRA|nr:hypothetical protein PR002_g27675 [Phytophthora rubi]